MTDENYDEIIHKKPVCNTYDRVDDIKPIIWRKPDIILPQNGRNSLKNNANKIIKHGKQQKIGENGWKRRDKAWVKESKVVEDEIEETNTKAKKYHWVKNVRIQSFSGPYSVRMRENTN